MKKRFYLFVVLTLALTGVAFTQNHWISLEIKGPGAGLRYEYVINSYFTVSGYFSYTIVTIPIFDYQMDSVEFGATARWYPSGRRFFTELSLGYNTFTYNREEYHSGDRYNSSYYTYEQKEGSGFCVAPGFGWTIDTGRKGLFFLAPSVKFPITIGSMFNITVAPYLGFGIAF